MVVRLKSFRYLSRGAAGWTSGVLPFGQLVTFVKGPNGAGKTPIMKGVMKALGHELEIPPQIEKMCEFAEATLLVDGGEVTLRRHLVSDFRLERLEDGNSHTFTSPSEFAKWFLALFSTSVPSLTDKQSKETPLYANLLFPAFWVDQDHAWGADYWTPP